MSVNKYARNWDEMQKRLETEAGRSGGGYTSDPRLYRPKFNKDGTFAALIRFLPAPGDEIPLVKVFAHRFKGRNGEYNEECPTTIGGQCPVCDANTDAWNSGDQQTARSRARSKNAVSNVIIINDPQSPENNGKIFLYRYGKTILAKILAATNPDEKQRQMGVKSIQIFDYYSGANFRINAVKEVKGANSFPNYGGSSFDSISSIGDDAAIEVIESKLISLKSFIDPSNFKKYHELQERFNTVIGVGATKIQASPPVNADHTPVVDQPSMVIPDQSRPAPIPAPAFDAEPDEIDDAEFFNNIRKKK